MASGLPPLELLAAIGEPGVLGERLLERLAGAASPFDLVMAVSGVERPNGRALVQ